MNLPSRLEILRHKVSWGADPFLICRSITPVEVREFRSACNCFPCRRSRLHYQADRLSHPFGSHLDYPVSRFRYSLHLRKSCDTRVDLFARSNAVCLLRMMFTDRENRSFDDWPILIPRKSIRGLVQDVISTQSGTHRSLHGLFYSALDWYHPIRKGPRLLRRARRSHSICPQFPITKIPESTDTWCSDSTPLDDYITPNTLYPDFAKSPSSIERLVLERHFHGRVNLNFSDSIMSERPKNARNKRTRSLVSLYKCSNCCFLENFDSSKMSIPRKYRPMRF